MTRLTISYSMEVNKVIALPRMYVYVKERNGDFRPYQLFVFFMMPENACLAITHCQWQRNSKTNPIFTNILFYKIYF